MQLAPGMPVTADLTLVRPLMDGAMGRVWVGHHQGLGVAVAVKFIAAHGARDPQLLARFEREASAAAQLDNPNVVRILEHGATADGMPYLAMELLEGETLADRLERDVRLPLLVAAHILRQIGNALDAAHARGIVHRDIKPANVFLIGGDLPHVKILDFGMAKRVRDHAGGELTATGVAVGTPEYMSPEQVLGSKEVDLRSDLWALGALTFRMLTARSPFAGDTPHALFFNICNGAFPPLHEVGLAIELEPWFRRVFTPNKAKRFGSAREMVLRFESILLKLGGPMASFDEESTQLMDVDRMLAGEVAVSDDEVTRTHDLSALRLSGFDLLDPDDDHPTFQLSVDQAEALHAEAMARFEDGSPLPLLRPLAADRPSLSAANEAPPESKGPVLPARAPALPAESVPASGRGSVSDAEVMPLEVPGSARPRSPRTAIDSLPPPRFGNGWKVALAGGMLAAGLAAAFVVQREKATAEAEEALSPRSAPAAPPPPASLHAPSQPTSEPTSEEASAPRAEPASQPEPRAQKPTARPPAPVVATPPLAPPPALPAPVAAEPVAESGASPPPTPSDESAAPTPPPTPPSAPEPAAPSAPPDEAP